jgi:hypothetical protein
MKLKTKLKGEKIMTIKKTLAALGVAMMLATLIAFTGTKSNVSAGGETAPDLEGSWEVTVMPDGGDPIVDFATFTRGGGIINSDPDPNLSTGIGTWVKTGGDQFAGTFRSFLERRRRSPGHVESPRSSATRSGHGHLQRSIPNRCDHWRERRSVLLRDRACETHQRRANRAVPVGKT